MAPKVTYNIVEYDSSNFTIWDNFVDKSINGNIFHKQQFLSYHPPDKFKFKHLLIYNNKNKLICLIPGGISNNKFISPIGSSFGGFIISKKNTLAESIDLVNSLVIFCKEKGYNGIKVTPPMQIYNKIFNQNILLL